MWKIFLGASVASTARVIGPEATSARAAVAKTATSARAQQGSAGRRLTRSILDRDPLDPPLPFLTRARASIPERERLGPEQHGRPAQIGRAGQLAPEWLVQRHAA